MSKTDKTAPLNIKAMMERRFVVESHDHTNGECNLPERPTVDNVGWWHSGDNCGWVYSPEFWNSGISRCACSMCGYDAYESIPRRKRQRIEGKRYVRDGWREEY